MVSEHFNPIFTDNLQLLAPFRNTVCTPGDLDFWHDALLACAARTPAITLGELLLEQLPPSPGIGLADNALNALKMLVGHKRWQFPIEAKPFLDCTFSDFSSLC